MDQFSELVIATLTTVPFLWRLVILFLFAFAEGLPVIGSISPGGTIAILAGSLSFSGLIPPIAAFMLISIGSFLGDMTGFLLSKQFRHMPFIQKIVTHEKHQKSWDLFDRHIAIISIFGKVVPFIRSTPSIFAAARGVQTRRYVFYSFIGSILWGFIGVYSGNMFTRYFGERAISFIVVVLLASVLIVASRYIFKNRLFDK